MTIMNYKSLTDEAVKNLAEDMYKGKFFTDRNVHDINDLPRVFMPLAFIDQEVRDEMLKIPVGMIFEYVDEALPWRINGMPIFASFRILSDKDAIRVQTHARKLAEIVKNAKVNED